MLSEYRAIQLRCLGPESQIGYVANRLCCKSPGPHRVHLNTAPENHGEKRGCAEHQPGQFQDAPLPAKPISPRERDSGETIWLYMPSCFLVRGHQRYPQGRDVCAGMIKVPLYCCGVLGEIAAMSCPSEIRFPALYESASVTILFP